MGCISQSWVGSLPGVNQAIWPSFSLPLGCQPITSTRWLVDLLHARHSTRLDVNGKKLCADFELDGKTHAIEARFLLVNFGRNVLAKFLGKPYQPDPTDEGSVFKINMLLRRLPKLKTKIHPEAEAFCENSRTVDG